MAKSWKGVERRIADELGTNRTPLSGSNSRHTASDTLHHQLFVEVKSWKSVSLWDEFRDLRRRARARDKEPMFLLQEKGMDEAPLHIITEFETALDYDQLELCSLEDFAEFFLLDHDVQARSPYFKLFGETIDLALEEGKRPIVVICKNRSPIKMAITNADWWGESWELERPDL